MPKCEQFLYSIKDVEYCAKRKSNCREVQLKQTEFLLRFTDIGLNAPNITIYIEDKESSSAPKKFEDEVMKALLNEHLQNH